MRVLFVGDVVGKSGRNALAKHLPFLKEKYGYDLLIINGENAAHGKGITSKIYNSFLEMGANCVTLGNHAFAKDNIYTFIDRADKLVRPANMNPLNVGRSVMIIKYQGKKIGVFNLYGNVFMENANGMPFETMDRLMEQYPCDIRIVDFHGETTGEKYAFLHGYYDKAAMIVGTHTHVPTCDERILKGGTAYITDIGMTGPLDGVIGTKASIIVDRFVNKSQNVFEPEDTGDSQFNAIILEIDDKSFKTVSIERINIVDKRKK